MLNKKLQPYNQQNNIAKNTARAATMVAVVTFISKIFGFIKQVLIGVKFGATGVTDAYLVSITVPAVIFATVANAISTTYIPIYSEIEAKSGEKGINDFTSNLINTVFVISFAISILGIIFARPLVKIFAIGFSGQTLEIATNFTRLTMLMCIFTGISNILSGYLKANYQFTIPIVIEVFDKVILIGALLIADLIGIWGFVIATVIGSAITVIMKIPAAKRNGFCWRLGINFKDKELLLMVSLIIPVIMSTGVQQINTLVDKMLASNLAEGSISALNFANLLNGFAYGLFTTSIATVIYPTLSRFSVDDKIEDFKKVLNNAVSFVVVIIMPLMVGGMLLRVPIVRFLFERGAFDSRATYMTATALLYYSLGMMGFGIRDVLNHSFYSIKDTKTPMLNGTMVVGINVILNLIFVKIMGLGGLALATSISAIVGTVLLFYHLRKKIGNLGGKKIVTSFLKASISGIVMGIVVKCFYNYISSVIIPSGIVAQGIDLGITIVIGALVYIFMSFLLKMDEISLILRMFKGKKTTIAK